MKGASADVCANTSSAPTRTRSSRIGASHHFFRTRSSAHTSRTTLAWLIACASSEQTFHVTPTAGPRLPGNPAARLQPRARDRIPSREAQHYTDRRDRVLGREREDARRHEAVPDGAEPHPAVLERPESGRRHERGHHEERAQSGGYGCGGVPAPPQHRAQHEEHAPDREAEPASFGRAQSSWNSRLQSPLSFQSGCRALSSKNGPSTRWSRWVRMKQR